MDPVGVSSAQPSRVAVALREQARQSPERAAVWDLNRRITYAELDALVGALALRIAEARGDLGEYGVLPLVVGRGVASVVTINAAIRAGVPFAPVDTGLPPAALASILHRLDDPQVAVVADPAPTTRLPGGIRVIPALQPTREALDPQPVDAAALGRIIFTSGSSGEPKGVMVSWFCMDSYVDDPVLRPAPDVDDRALNLAPMSFAMGALAAMRPALGTAVSTLDPNALDPLDLLERVDADRLTSVALVPSHVASVVDRWPAGRRLESVRAVNAYGEALEWPMVAAMRPLLPQTSVIVNYYGSTETVIAATYLVIDAATPLGTGRVPMGRPATSDRVRLEPVPGLEGDRDAPQELVVRTPRLSMGYWRDEEATARAYGRDPDGTPFWRTGDLVRADADGVLHFVGRADNVVKINGKLVEPSEPERALGAIAGIRRAVVLVQPSPRGGQRLVAHVEVDPASGLEPAEVRRVVADQVAPHLVPAVLVRHAALPLTARDKVDRQALLRAEPEPWHRQSSDRPATLNEAAVLSVAAEVLGFDGFGPDDDLWELGLDSLGATELLATLTDFGWAALPESVLLEHRTAAAIASLRGQFVPAGDAIWLNTEGGGPLVACVLGPSSDALTFRRLAQELAPDHPVGILRQFDPAGTADVPRTVTEIAASVRRSAERGPTARPAVVVGYSGSGVVAYDLARQYAADGVDVHVVLIDAPAGARTVIDQGRFGGNGALAARLRRSARQALVRALPAAALPQKERAYARFDLAGKASQEYQPPVTDLPVTLFRATHSGLPDLEDAWTGTTPNLTVIELDCDHDAILGTPHVGVIADHVRMCAPAER